MALEEKFDLTLDEEGKSVLTNVSFDMYTALMPFSDTAQLT